MKHGLARWALAAGCSVAVHSHSRAARADVSQTDRTLAQSLFEQGKQLMQSGRYADACPKLEESQRLDPGGGTMLNLALCYEDAGKISTAWADFKEALSMARRDGRPEREQASQEHIAALEPKLPRLTLNVGQIATDEELRLDGAAIGKAAWGSPMSVDPGTHQVSASAPGRSGWSQTVEIAIAEQKVVVVPALGAGDAPAAGPVVAPPPAGGPAVAPGQTTAAQPAPRTPSSSGGGHATAGWIVGGTGVVLAAVGGVFGARAISKRHDSDKFCPADNRCTAEGVSLNDDAKTAAWVADAGVGLGIVGIGVGAYLILSSRGKSESPPGAAVAKTISLDAKTLPSGGEVTVGGVW